MGRLRVPGGSGTHGFGHGLPGYTDWGAPNPCIRVIRGRIRVCRSPNPPTAPARARIPRFRRGIRMAFGLVTAALALGAGLLSFASPCVLPLVPAYLGYITGQSIDELARGSGARRRQALLTALAFVLGLAVIFTLLGASASAVGHLLLNYQSLVT